ncbi:MAG: winged helix-turn-helix transcriptional regulator [Nitrospinales bacterium]
MKNRSYNQYCALARGLDIVGERWTLLLIRELLIDPKRYKELLEGLHGIGTNLLATRLKDLENKNIIERTTLPPPYKTIVYQLTDFGRELEPVVLSITKWGFNYMDKKKSHELTRTEWDLVALKAAFQPEKSAKMNANFELHLDKICFNIIVNKGTIDIKLGSAEKAKVKLTTSGKSLLSLGKDATTFEKLLASGELAVEGNLASAKQFLKLFLIN